MNKQIKRKVKAEFVSLAEKRERGNRPRPLLSNFKKPVVDYLVPKLNNLDNCQKHESLTGNYNEIHSVCTKIERKSLR
jgi:hypothetical protein